MKTQVVGVRLSEETVKAIKKIVGPHGSVSSFIRNVVENSISPTVVQAEGVFQNKRPREVNLDFSQDNVIGLSTSGGDYGKMRGGNLQGNG